MDTTVRKLESLGYCVALLACSLAALIQYQHVMDRQTDGHMMMANTALATLHL